MAVDQVNRVKTVNQLIQIVFHSFFFRSLPADKVNTNVPKYSPIMGRWGRQSPVEPVDAGAATTADATASPPPLPPRKAVSRQSSFTKLGSILNPNKNSSKQKANAPGMLINPSPPPLYMYNITVHHHSKRLIDQEYTRYR